MLLSQPCIHQQSFDAHRLIPLASILVDGVVEILLLQADVWLCAQQGSGMIAETKHGWAIYSCWWIWGFPYGTQR